MPERVDWIPDEEWQTIVANVPIVSIDLVIKTPEGVVLAQRQNEPARGEWFVPGGRVLKGEHLEEAVYRVANEELGIDVVIEESLGVYEHLYETADVEGAGGKHHVAYGFVVATDTTEFELDSQHDRVDIFAEIPDDLHPYIEQYLQDARIA